MKAEEILKELSLEEKASLCSGRDFWTLKGIERLGIAPVMVTDGPHGVRKQAGASDQLGLNESIAATCFPPACTTACSFDRSLLYKVGEAIGEECLQEDVAVVLGPGVNIKRGPLCGRNFEYLSEDPLLGGELAAALIEGVQSKGVGTSLKHYAANNQETARLVSDSVIDERALRELYLAGFERAVTTAQPWTVMCSYNLINGVYAAENKKLLNDVLRSEWGFAGLVITDWGATVGRVTGLEAGLDLEMPGGDPFHDTQIVQAVQSGALDEKVLDASALRVLRLILNAVETHKKAAGFRYDAVAHHALAQKAAGESAVLLQNGILPLNPSASVAVIGAFAKNPRYQGAGSSKIAPTMLDNAWEALAAAGFAAAYAPGYALKGEGDEEALIQEAAALAASKDVALVFAGLPDEYESEGFDRATMDLPASHNRLIEAVAAANPNTAVILQLGSPVRLPWRDKVPTILAAYLGGQGGGKALADIICGAVNPGGKLAETWPLALEDTPCYGHFGSRRVEYRESIFVGYRYYQSAGKSVAFPFGHGVSYTSFAYSGLRVAPRADGTAAVSFTLTNSGTRDGAEAPQLYVSKPAPRVYRPQAELKEFTKVFLRAGESAEVAFTLQKRDFAYYNTAAAAWAVEGGAYEIRIGASSEDIRLRGSVQIDGDGREKALSAPPAPYGDIRATAQSGVFTVRDAAFEALLGRPLAEKAPESFSINSTLEEIRDTPAGGVFYEQVKQAMEAMMVGNSADFKMMLEAMMNDMPLRLLAMTSPDKVTFPMLEELIAAMNSRKG